MKKDLLRASHGTQGGNKTKQKQLWILYCISTGNH